ncbi:hypothetical protein [Kribbella sp. CCNWLY201]|uniref:hypothetical protein n=1 Tax=Kribbella sp. CCNWLY201 TaxID=3128544 RepID=UPI0030189499
MEDLEVREFLQRFAPDDVRETIAWLTANGYTLSSTAGKARSAPSSSTWEMQRYASPWTAHSGSSTLRQDPEPRRGSTTY